MHLPAPLWMREDGPDGDVVVSTRCRVARNLAGFPFPWRASELERKQAAEAALNAAERSGHFRDSRPIRGAAVDGETAVHLLRLRYASRDWVSGGNHRWLAVSSDTILSLLVNEEDHIRLQSITPGLQVESVLLRASEAARSMGSSVAFAYSPDTGFLTTYLTNAGTGMRISVLVHLSGLASAPTGRLETVLEAARTLGCAVRGLYGEGTSGTGELFQVSNRYTFGTTPEQIADRVASAAKYIVEAERQARKEQFGSDEGTERLRRQAGEAIRAVFATELTPVQLLRTVSTLRMGVAQGVIPGRLSDTADWVAIAGTEAATETGEIADNEAKERFHAISRTAALRQKLRPLLNA